MPLFIGKSYLDRIVNRFALSRTPSRAGQNIMSQVIAPVTDADKLLRSRTITRIYAAADPGAAGSYRVATVPVGKYWTVFAVYCARVTGATLTLDFLELVNSASTSVIRVVSQTAAASLLWLPAAPIPLDTAQWLQLHVSGYNAGDTMSVDILYEEEDAY